MHASLHRDVNKNQPCLPECFQFNRRGTGSHYCKEKTNDCCIVHKALIYKHTNIQAGAYTHSTAAQMLESSVEEHQTTTGTVRIWPNALTTLMRVDQISFVQRG